MQHKMKWIVAADEDQLLLRTFLQHKEISKRALTAIKFDGGKIEVNGAEMTVRAVLQAGDKVEVTFPPEQRSGQLNSEPVPLEVIYEDATVLIINKQPMQNTIPSREHPSGSVANALMGYYDQHGIASAAHIVTRLDRDTSGLMLIAKHRHAHHLLSQAQQNNTVSRVYKAIVHGCLEGSGVIDAPIGRKGTSIIEREVTEEGQFARTHYHSISSSPERSVIRLTLETGRTHQIRVHLAHIGHPLVGDDLYGGKRDMLDRQALHCEKLTFFHPETMEEMTFLCPVPEDMARYLNENQ